MVKAHLLAFYIYTSPFPPPYRPLLPPSPVLFPHRLHLLFPCLIFPLPSSTLFFFFLVLFVCDLTALFLGTVRYSLMPTLNHEISRRLNKRQGQRSLKREEEIKCKAGELGRFTAGGKKRREGRKLRREEAVMISS